MTAPEHLVGQTLLQRYRVTQHLASGGFGNAFMAQDIALPGHPACGQPTLLDSLAFFLTLTRRG